jgi:hypothetical protein
LYCETIRNPLDHDLYARREFFDTLPLSGDVSILQRLHNEISLELRDHQMVIPLLTNDTLAHLPPLTFFQCLVLQLDGAQSDSFDIRSAAVTPITDAARVFSIAKGDCLLEHPERLAAAQPRFPRERTRSSGMRRTHSASCFTTRRWPGSRIDAGKVGRSDQLLLKTAFSIHRLLEFTASTFLRTV